MLWLEGRTKEVVFRNRSFLGSCILYIAGTGLSLLLIVKDGILVV